MHFCSRLLRLAATSSPDLNRSNTSGHGRASAFCIEDLIADETGRILGFEIDVDALGASSVSLYMRDVAQEVVRKAIVAAREHEAPSALDPWSRIQLNSRVASRVLEDRGQGVFAAQRRDFGRESQLPLVTWSRSPGRLTSLAVSSL